MDGLTFTSILKNDIKTFHIPIILLTSKNSVEQQVKGIKYLADAYLCKPFHLQVLCETIKSIIKNRERLREHYTSGLATESHAKFSSRQDKKFISDFNSIIESNLGNENFTVEDICHEMRLSRVLLYKKIKTLLGFNVNDYILTTRLQKAKYLLKQSTLSIAEIAYKVGFSSAAYFSTVFKAKFNMTPKEFKEKDVS